MTTLRPILHALFAFCALCLAAGSAEARPYDAKALARYDRSYVQCEANNPAMKGHRDEAYLNLWRIPPDEKAMARLSKLRADPAYAVEQKRAVKAPAAASAAASSVALQRQCRGLWSENQRAAADAPAPKRP